MEYYVDHRGNQFYIITNADGKNYKVHEDFVFVTFCSFITTRNDLNSDWEGTQKWYTRVKSPGMK